MSTTPKAKRDIVQKYLSLRIVQLQGWLNEAAGREDDAHVMALSNTITTLAIEHTWLDEPKTSGKDNRLMLDLFKG